MKKVLFSILFIGAAIAAKAQKSEVAEAKKKWNIYQLTLLEPEKPRTGPSQARNTEEAGMSEMRSSAGGRRGGGGAGLPAPGGNRPQAPKKFDNYISKQLAAVEEGLAHTEKAIHNDKTSTLAEAWTYRALFSAAGAIADTLNLANSQRLEKISEEAIAKAKEFKPSKDDVDNIQMAEALLTDVSRIRGLVAYNSKNYKGAYESFKNVVDKNPTDTTMLSYMAYMAKEAQDYKNSIDAYKRAIDLNSSESKIFYSEIYEMTINKLKDTAAAINVLKEAGRKFPDDLYFITNEADIYVKQGNSAKTDEILEKLMSKDPNNLNFVRVRADAYFNQAFDLQEKIKNFEEAKKFKEADALIKEKDGLLNKALPLYLKIETVESKDADLIKLIKQIYFATGNNEKAAEYQKKQDSLK